MKPKASTHRNVTLSLPETLLKQLKVFAAQREKSMSALMTEELEKLISQAEARMKATSQLRELMDTAPSRTASEELRWKREDAYEHLER